MLACATIKARFKTGFFHCTKGLIMMDEQEREVALKMMEAASSVFYSMAVKIGNHPFIEFTGLMNEYINACQEAHKNGIDFSDCDVHTGVDLPLRGCQVDYINEKLECIFTGRSVMQS